MSSATMTDRPHWPTVLATLWVLIGLGVVGLVAGALAVHVWGL